ncbi:hypothetical protein X566_19965 [Afipia sp. P52-10]|uniref:hypothetical protein n=1 Tax=Afipia sp. P52-10 TaxID=1429916 RepID=UPI0003DF066F|nr:hypothetical protein [Afipia sp. P52-10]ETR75894.1 hypothetical protein X566_19965 [Afipia sp. P52-10]
MSVIETLPGRPAPSRILHGALIFDRHGPYAAREDCFAFLQARGFSIGEWQSGSPCAVMFGPRRLPKWRNIAIADRQRLHGLIMGDGFHGPLVVKLTSSAPADARLAIATQ